MIWRPDSGGARHVGHFFPWRQRRLSSVILVGMLLAFHIALAQGDPIHLKETRKMTSDEKAIRIARTAVQKSERYKQWVSKAFKYMPMAHKVSGEAIRVRLSALKSSRPSVGDASRLIAVYSDPKADLWDVSFNLEGPGPTDQGITLLVDLRTEEVLYLQEHAE